MFLKISLIAFLVFFFSEVSSDISLLKYHIRNTDTGMPVSFSKVCLSNIDTNYCVSSDIEGLFILTLSTIKPSDSAMLKISIPKTISDSIIINQNVAVSDLLTGMNLKFDNYELTLKEHREYTKDEYKRYIREKGGMPERQKSKAKDIY